MEGTFQNARTVTERATGKRLREVYQDGLRFRGGAGLREISTRTSGRREEAGCAPEVGLRLSMWLAGVRRIKAVPRVGVHSTDRQFVPSAGGHVATGSVWAETQERSP